MQINVSDKLQTMFSLEGKTAAITGAGGVLFGAVARGLSQLGVKVAALDLRLNEAQKTADEIKAAGGNAFATEIDVLKPERVTKARDAVLANFGRVDILINGAGGNHPKAVTKQEEGLFFSDLSVDGPCKSFPTTRLSNTTWPMPSRPHRSGPFSLTSFSTPPSRLTSTRFPTVNAP